MFSLRVIEKTPFFIASYNYCLNSGSALMNTPALVKHFFGQLPEFFLTIYKKKCNKQSHGKHSLQVNNAD